VDERFDDVHSLAGAVRAHLDLCGTGVLVANPVPAEHELKAEVWDTALEQALVEAEYSGIHGRDTTPFLLERLRVLTQGRSVSTNQALLLNNARLAGELAVALARTSR
jgi:pseudouridine-5'-phosphate glycosidase